MPKKIKYIFLKTIKEKSIDLLNKFFDSIDESNFIKTAFMNAFYFLILYCNKDLFFISYNESGTFSNSEINIIYNSILFFLYIMLIYSIYLIFYGDKNREKKKLSKKGYEKYIENEYKNNNGHFLDGVKYFVTILLSISAIYITIIAIQGNFDVANKIDGEYVNAKNTLKMLESYYTFIGISISTFIFCFLWYRMNIQIKKNFIENEYYKLYKKRD